MQALWRVQTSSATAELDLRHGSQARSLRFYHHMTGTTLGGYVSLRLREKSLNDALTEAAAIDVLTASRAANVTTVTTDQIHGLAVGDLAILRNVRGTTEFNGEFVVVGITSTKIFTYADVGTNDTTGVGGNLRTIMQVAHPGDGYNIPTGNETANYVCDFGNINSVVEVKLNITDGIHKLICSEGLGVIGPTILEASDIEIGAVEIKNGTTDQRAVVDTTGALRVTPSNGALTNKSGTIAAPDVSETLAAANAARKFFFFQNISDTDMWINFTTAAVKDSPSIKVGAGGEAFSMEGGFVSTEAITIICSAGGKKWTAKEG